MPSASSCFLHIFGFAGNQYLQGSKSLANLIRFFSGNEGPRKLWERSRGDVGGPHGLGPRRLPVWGPPTPPYADSTAINSYKYRNLPPYLQKNFIANSCFAKIQSRGLFRSSAGGGVHYWSLLHQPCYLHDDV